MSVKNASTIRKEPDLNSSDYNYSEFTYDHYNFDLFTQSGPQMGSSAIDFEAYTVDGRKVNLSDFKGKTIVLESGSITCPMYVRNINKMSDLVVEYPDVVFIVLYVREAHPGGKIGEHLSYEEKNKRAVETIKADQEHRLVMIDDIQGSAHRTYGLLPNFVYIIDSDFSILYKADWAIPKKIAVILDQIRSSEKEIKLPIPTLIPPSPGIFYKVFKRAGWRSAYDFFIRSNFRIPLTFVKLKRKWRKQKKEGAYH